METGLEPPGFSHGEIQTSSLTTRTCSPLQISHRPIAIKPRATLRTREALYL